MHFTAYFSKATAKRRSESTELHNLSVPNQHFVVLSYVAKKQYQTSSSELLTNRRIVTVAHEL